MFHFSRRHSVITRFLTASVAAVLFTGGSITAASAADSTGAVDTTYGGTGNNGVFYGTTPAGATSSSTVQIVPELDGTTYHLVQHMTGGVLSGYSITHLKADGTVDSIFDSDGTTTVNKLSSESNLRVYKMLLTTVNSERKILVLGTHATGGTYLARFNADTSSIGELDTTFGTNGEARHITNVFLTDGSDLTVGSAGKIYVWGQDDRQGKLARFSALGSDDQWGNPNYSPAKSYIAAPPASNVTVSGITVDDTSSPVKVTVWGADRTANSTKAIIGRWTIDPGNQPVNGSSGAAEASVDTTYAASGYRELATSVTQPKPVSYSISPNNNVYMLLTPTSGSANTSVVGFNLSTGAVVSSFQSNASPTAGQVVLSNFYSVYDIAATKTSANKDRVYVLGLESSQSTFFIRVDAFDDQGDLDANFGALGQAKLTTCPRGLSAATISTDNNGSVIIGGGETSRYFSLKLGSDTYSPTPTCGQSSSQGGGGGGTGGGGGFTLPKLTGTVTEAAGPAIKLTVDSLAAGANIVVMVAPSSYVPGPMSSEGIAIVQFPVGTTSIEITKISWEDVMTRQISRTESLKAGVEYIVSYWQSVSSPNAAPVRGSSTLARITLTGNVAPTTGASTVTQPATTPAAQTPVQSTSKTEVVPGVTVTDTKVYTKAPAQVASGSAVTVLTPTQVKTQTIRTSTPAVCVPTADDIVFIDEGRCNATVLSKKTGEVLRRLRTTVVDSDVTELGIGNEIVTLAPIYFEGGSADLNPAALKRLRALKERITAAGTVLVVGHSGTLMGNTPENIAISRDRAVNTVRAMKRIGAKGPFYSTGAGALDPVTTSSDRTEQNKNRRVVVVLVP